ncbi:MAG TPA: transketolase C-terminal domain-containing protein, partial [Candidatus Manganitrophaceae bacterium]|nr:transketolase C-terminal domain-containing protein [Candidatus Manganitrophaceae bacterium]
LVSIANRCRKIITLEEHALAGGFGEAVLALLEEERGAGRIPQTELRRIGIPDQFIEHGSQKILRQKLGLDAEQIFSAAVDFCKEGLSASTLAPRRGTQG